MDVLLKQRLVGAIVLVALGVIFIPMLLEGPNQTLVPDMGDMPMPEMHAPELPLKPFPPVAEPAQAERAVVTDATGVETPDGAPPPAAPKKPAEAESTPSVVVPSKPVETPVKVGKPAVVVPAGSWIVQVVSLSNKANALALRDTLRKGGFSTQVEQVRVDGKTHYRVRVGPFLQRTDADQARKQIAERFEQNGRVMSWRN